MHDGEVATSADLVRRLVATAFPQWAGLEIAPVPSAGTDNALYRLGDERVVRLPRVGWAAGQGAKEAAWLPRLAPRLPLAVPEPLARGAPAEGYPWSWGVYRWIEGRTAAADEPADPVRVAGDLARFVAMLHDIDTAGGPPPGEHNSGRGVPLAERDARTRAAIADCAALVDSRAAVRAWERALAAPVSFAAPVWIHGDLQPGNLLLRQGRLVAVIDFGCLAVGDPAVDLLPAWNLFEGAARAAYRAELAVDEATWERGRGWALSVAAIALAYYRDSNPALAAQSRRTIDAVLADLG